MVFREKNCANGYVLFLVLGKKQHLFVITYVDRLTTDELVKLRINNSTKN